ncbi:TolC family protein [Sphingomonas rhizophila]|uniref:TolC family protein n=1 Tax=Sphingomonas rhizophila TaxID=2071607 RepID=A0A7G9SCN9_9SPHN|nr:TolC family protein [Sphingomonas rhizophila]QNN65614.1 TolC family protein [Sphingomonas rhizophila]
MRFLAAAACAAVAAAGPMMPAAAQVGNPATPRVGSPSAQPAGPPAPVVAPRPEPRAGPLPGSLSLPQALDEAAARSPAIVAAEAEVAAAEARIRQAGYRSNPELSVEVENFAGTGELRGLRSTETTVALNQRLDLGGRRSARVNAAQAALEVQKLKLAMAKADLLQSVREQFARAIAAREKLAQATENEGRARELARVAGILVEAGRDPPLRALRARSALAQAQAAREAAAADELAARSSLAALFGVSEPVWAVSGTALDVTPRQVNPDQSLDVRLADAERVAAQAGVREQLAERRLDPAVGVGVRHIRETGDVGLVAGLSMPLRLFDRNQGNIEAARQAATAADARRASTLATTTAKARNAIANVEAAQRRVEALERAAVPEATEALRLAELSYREGRASLIELIDIQNAYTAARTSLTEARLELALATADLGRILAQ